MSEAHFFAGIDVGSAFTKAVLLRDTETIAFEIITSGGDYKKAAETVIERLFAKGGASFQDTRIIATGVGSGRVSFAFRQISDISCQARGANYLFPTVRTVIDIGGQTSKVIKVDAYGGVVDFVISEKCAAGSGRFLQMVARIFGIELEELGYLSLKSKQPVEFSTSCAVFAESEAISRIAEGTTKEDIIAGVHKAIATKIVSLVKRVGLSPDCLLTGGGAKDVGLVKAITEALEMRVFIPEEPQITAALGAACFARDATFDTSK